MVETVAAVPVGVAVTTVGLLLDRTAATTPNLMQQQMQIGIPIISARITTNKVIPIPRARARISVQGGDYRKQKRVMEKQVRGICDTYKCIDRLIK